MELLHARCAALEIVKKDLKACLRLPPLPGRKARRQRVSPRGSGMSSFPPAGSPADATVAHDRH